MYKFLYEYSIVIEYLKICNASAVPLSDVCSHILPSNVSTHWPSRICQTEPVRCMSAIFCEGIVCESGIRDD